MMSTLRPLSIFTFSLILTFVVQITSVQAGGGCRQHKATVVEFSSSMDTAQELRTTLNRTGDNVVLLARVGSDISQYGLTYTHVGIARKRQQSQEWEVVHQLNPCSSDTSVLRVNGLANFMLDDLYTHDIQVIRLGGELAQELGYVLKGDGPRKVYEPRYSMISYPGLPAKYQNSNQWVLELITLAQARLENQTLTNRQQTHKYYLRQGFKGSPIHLSALRRAFVRVGSKNVKFDDHPSGQRFAGRFETVSVKSVISYLSSTGSLIGVYEIKTEYIRSE